MSGDFPPEQKRYLEGFVSGLQIARAARGLGGNAGLTAAVQTPDAAAAQPVGPDAVHLLAQDRVVKAGGKLSDQEKFKRELHPFDGYEKLKAQAAANEPPKPDDNFRWRFFGLFYCAPTQKTYMCRLRIPNGILKHWQFDGPRRPRRDLCRRLRPRHHPRQPADARDRAEERGQHGRGRSRTSACARAAPAPTTSATSPARRPPASIRRN